MMANGESEVRIPKGLLGGLGALGGVVTVLVLLFGAVRGVVTKSDLNPVQATLASLSQDHYALKQQVSDLERQVDRFFGGGTAAPKASSLRLSEMPSVVGVSQSYPEQRGIPDASRQATARAYAERRPVAVPEWFIARHKLQPSSGGGLLLRGEDGNLYLLDDVIAGLAEGQRQR